MYTRIIIENADDKNNISVTIARTKNMYPLSINDWDTFKYNNMSSVDNWMIEIGSIRRNLDIDIMHSDEFVDWNNLNGIKTNPPTTGWFNNVNNINGHHIISLKNELGSNKADIEIKPKTNKPGYYALYHSTTIPNNKLFNGFFEDFQQAIINIPNLSNYNIYLYIGNDDTENNIYTYNVIDNNGYNGLLFKFA